MKKGFLGGFLTCALVMALISTAFAAHSRTDTLYFRDIKLMVNGELVEVTDSTGAKIEPFIINGTTYLPVGNVAKMVGYDVKWDGETSTVILELPEAKTPTYITKTGSKYHKDSTCNGGTYFEVSFDTALKMGLEPCDKCVH